MTASRSLEDLHPEMRKRVDAWLLDCARFKMDVLVYCTYRPLEEQARLFRINRRLVVINAAAEKLRRAGLEVQATVLLSVGPQPGTDGPKRTKALPGLSFHQRHEFEGASGAMAIDHVHLDGGKALWNDKAAFLASAELAENRGLTWLGRSKSFRELVHLQFDRLGTLDKWTLAKGGYA